MLKSVEYIKQHGLDAFVAKYQLHAKRHNTYPNLVLLKYDQLNSPMGVEAVQECRGLILDEANWNVVSYPYKKFFNYGEGHADTIDWENARVYEKLDGSLMTLYFYYGKWHVASSGLPDASGEVMGCNFTFEQLFWKVWKESGYKTPPRTDACYMFELMTPYNRVVVRHKESKLILHGARKLSDFRELNPVVVAHENGWECVKIHSLGSWDEIQETAKELDPMESEGYVVCDTNYNRVKVKSPQYVAVSHMKDGFTTRRLLEIVRTNESSEFLSYYPEYSELYYQIKAKYERLLGQMEGFYEAIKDIDDKKQFALKATTQKYSGSLFGVKNGKFKDFRHALSEMNLKQLEEWLGIRFVEL